MQAGDIRVEADGPHGFRMLAWICMLEPEKQQILHTLGLEAMRFARLSPESTTNSLSETRARQLVDLGMRRTPGRVRTVPLFPVDQRLAVRPFPRKPHARDRDRRSSTGSHPAHSVAGSRHPHNRYASLSEALSAFEAARAATVRFRGGIQRRPQILDHRSSDDSGPVTCYEILLLMSIHPVRHAEQSRTSERFWSPRLAELSSEITEAPLSAFFICRRNVAFTLRLGSGNEYLFPVVPS